MPGNAPRIYVDACVLLAYVGDEAGRADIVLAMLDASRRGEIEVLTSVLSVAEVAYGGLERDAGLTAAGEAEIDKLWAPASPITLVDVSEPLARTARSSIRSARDKKLSLHLWCAASRVSTAVRVRADLDVRR